MSYHLLAILLVIASTSYASTESGCIRMFRELSQPVSEPPLYNAPDPHPIFGKMQAGMGNDPNRFGFHPEEYDKAVAALEQSEITPAQLRSGLEHLNQSGLEYSISVKTKDGKELDGYVYQLTQMGGEYEVTLLLDNHGKFSPRVGISELDPKSIRIQREPVPATVFREPSVSKLAQDLGIASLQTQIRYKNSTENILYAIFKSGSFDSAAQAGQGRRANYLAFGERDWLQPARGLKAEELNQAESFIEFETSLLDRPDYFINPGWQYGEYSRESIPADDAIRLRKYLYQHSLGKYWANSNEIVFLRPIAVSAIKRVYLPPEVRLNLIQRLEKEGVKPPPGRTWNALLVPYVSKAK